MYRPAGIFPKMTDSNGISGVVARALAGPATFCPNVGPAGASRPTTRLRQTRRMMAPPVAKPSQNIEQRKETVAVHSETNLQSAPRKSIHAAGSRFEQFARARPQFLPH